MNVQIINLEGEPTGPKRIAWKYAAERDRVQSFNRHMVEAGMYQRTTLWKGLV